MNRCISLRAYSVGLLALCCLGAALAWAQESEPAANDSSPVCRPEILIEISEETTVILEPLRKDGRVDYLAAFNARLSEGVTPKSNAMVGYLQAYGPEVLSDAYSEKFYELLGIEPLTEEGDYLQSYSEYLRSLELPPEEAEEVRTQFEAATDARNGCFLPDEYPHVAVWLDMNEIPLATLATASELPHMYRPTVAEDESGSLMLSLMSGMGFISADRDAVWALTARARMRAAVGDGAGALHDLAVARRLARHVGTGPLLIDGLVGMSMESIVLLAEEAVFSEQTWEAADIQSYREQLAALPPRTTFAECVDMGERYLALDGVQMMYIDGPEVLRQLMQFGVPQEEHNLLWNAYFKMADWNRVLRNVNAYYDELAEALAAEDYATGSAAFDRVQERILSEYGFVTSPDAFFTEYWARPHEEVLADIITVHYLQMFNMGGANIMGVEMRAQVNAHLIQVATAILEYRAAEGACPETLDALLPVYLPELPHDPFSGNPLIYQPTDEGFLLYSVGLNGIDDGGVPGEIIFEGDLVFELSEQAAP